MSSAKSAAKKQEKARKEQLELMAQERALENARMTAQLQRTARSNKAKIVNSSGARGLGDYSGAAGAELAIDSAQRREESYLSSQAALAASSDAITRAQFGLSSDISQQNAFSSGIGGAISGVDKFAGNFPALSDLFSGGSSAPNLGDVSGMF